MRTKLGIKIKRYKTVIDEIEKQNKSRKGLKKQQSIEYRPNLL